MSVDMDGIASDEELILITDGDRVRRDVDACLMIPLGRSRDAKGSSSGAFLFRFTGSEDACLEMLEMLLD